MSNNPWMDAVLEWANRAIPSPQHFDSKSSPTDVVAAIYTEAYFAGRDDERERQRSRRLAAVGAKQEDQ